MMSHVCCTRLPARRWNLVAGTALGEIEVVTPPLLLPKGKVNLPNQRLQDGSFFRRNGETGKAVLFFVFFFFK